VNRDVIAEGKISYKHINDCVQNPLAKAVFMLGEIEEVHFFENVITVTKSDIHPWTVMEEAIRATILQHIEHHDPRFIEKVKEDTPQTKLSPELQKIDDILEHTIRPGLRMDGGDLTILNLEGNVLSVQYEGACGSCPSSQYGTLEAIQNILRDEYNPEIEVVTF
jgi:Fe-S cluster biogenesis protein NfuA